MSPKATQASVPHPFAFFLANGWETTNPNQRISPSSDRTVCSAFVFQTSRMNAGIVNSTQQQLRVPPVSRLRPEKARISFRCLVVATLLATGLTCSAQTADQAWLDHYLWHDSNLVSTRIHPLGQDVLEQSAANQLKRGILRLHGASTVSDDNFEDLIAIGTADEARKAYPEVGVPANLPGDSYWIASFHRQHGTLIIVAGGDERGALYGSFALLRFIAENDSAPKEPLRSSPPSKSAGSTSGTIPTAPSSAATQAAASSSKAATSATTSPPSPNTRRLLASVGINGCNINNVNAAPQLLDSDHLKQIARIADALRPWGVHLAMSVAIASPQTIGGLSTYDPLDPAVKAWWAAKVDEIYTLIPDFAGFTVKADSEGQPGPASFGRTPADAANTLASALAPHGGVVLYRAFVYNHHLDWHDPKADRARAAYDIFHPLDGKFAPNVIVQTKEGPIDFQVREPVSPLFAGLEQTSQAMELQITQEYTGQQRHLVYLAPMWKEVLDFDLHADNHSTPVKEILAGKVLPSAARWHGRRSRHWPRPLARLPARAGQPLRLRPPRLGSQSRPRQNRRRVDAARPSAPTPKSSPPSRKCSCSPGPPMRTTPARSACRPSPTSPAPTTAPTSSPASATAGASGTTPTPKASARIALSPPAQATPASTARSRQALREPCHHPRQPAPLLPPRARTTSYQDCTINGKTVIQYIYDSHYEGAAQAAQFVKDWAALKGRIDPALYKDVRARLEYQAGHAIVWRDAIVQYFLKLSGIPDEQGRAGHYPGRLEAEDARLTGYKVIDVTPWEDASGGKAVSCARGNLHRRMDLDRRGQAVYNIAIQYFDLQGGIAKFTLLINNQPARNLASRRDPALNPPQRRQLHPPNARKHPPQTRRQAPYRRRPRRPRPRGSRLHRAHPGHGKALNLGCAFPSTKLRAPSTFGRTIRPISESKQTTAGDCTMRAAAAILILALAGAAQAQNPSPSSPIQIRMLTLVSAALPPPDRERVLQSLAGQPYIPDDFEERVRTSLRNLGYYNAHVHTARLSFVQPGQNAASADVSFKVEPGAQYSFGVIQFNGATIFTLPELRSQFPFAEGSQYNPPV